MSTATAFVALHAAVALFGFAALFGAWIEATPAVIVLGRAAVAALSLALFGLLRHKPLPRPGTALAWNGALLALHWVAFFSAVQAAGVAVALLGYASYPVFVLLLEPRSRARGFGGVEIATTLAVALGLALLLPDFSWSGRAARGLAWGVAAGFTFALITLCSRSLLARFSAPSIALWQNALAALWLVPVVVLQDGAAWPSARDILLITILGVFCTALAHTLFVLSLRGVSAHAASVVSLLEPVYGIALAAALLGQHPDARTLAGAALIVGAALTATRRSTP